MVHEEEKHDNELAVEGEKDDENEETEEQEHELGLGMVKIETLSFHNTTDSSPKPACAIKKSYYIQTFYIRKKPRNEWLTKVITTKKLDALLEASYLIIYSLLLYLNFYPETMRVYI